MKKYLAIGHRSSYLIQQCSILLNLLSKKERRALKFKIDFNMISDCFINSLGGKLFYLQKYKYMVSSHCTVTKFLNNTNIIHFLTNSKFLNNYFIFSLWLYKAILHSEHLSLRWKIRPFLSLYSHFLHWIVFTYQPLKISTNEEKKALFTFWLRIDKIQHKCLVIS